MGEDLALNLYDFGWRHSDPFIARTTTMDPHSESYLSLSSYGWAANNPVSILDPDGQDILYGKEAQDFFRELQANSKKEGEPAGKKFYSFNSHTQARREQMAQSANEDPNEQGATGALNTILNSTAARMIKIGVPHAEESEITPRLIAALYDGNHEQIKEQGIKLAIAVASALPLGKLFSVLAATVGEITIQRSVGAATRGFSRGLWTLTDKGASSTAINKTWGKFYKSASDGTWWVADRYGHGGSAFKVFKETPKGLEWTRDADKYGQYILGKHKEPTGTFIPWGQLKTIK